MSELNPDFDANKVTLMYLANSIYQDEQDKNEPTNKKRKGRVQVLQKKNTCDFKRNVER